MAVTKIRKISSWTLLISSLITVVVLGVFFFGGIKNPGEVMIEYNYTDLLLNWTYIIFFATLISTVLFAVWQLITSFKNDPKSALMSIGAIVLFVIILFITYAMGDGTLMTGLNADSEKFNTKFWLKVTDMWIYTTYVLIALIILAVIAGTVKRVLTK